MLDTQSIESLIRTQISALVEDRVNAVVADGSWMQDIERKIVTHVQDRITARFSNIESLPDLVKTVQSSVSELFSKGQIPGISDYVSKKFIVNAVDTSMQTLVKDTVDVLVLDQAWLAKIEEMVNQTFARKIMTSLNEIDFNEVIVKQVDVCIDRWYDRLRDKFETAGIKDMASQTQLTVMDGAVVAEGQLASTELLVDRDARVNGTLTVDKLILKGDVNVDNQSWHQLSRNIADRTIETLNAEWRDQLVDQVVNRAKNDGIDFQSVTINGIPLIENNRLSAAVTEIGVLSRLDVKGEANFFNTLHVGNRRIGVNTENPEMALGVWDEEVAVNIGKHSQNTAYVGTSRAQGLVLGVNKNAQITIDTDGLTTVKQLRVGQFRIGHATEVPGYAGNRGDMVFNSDPKPGQPFAWVCLGSYKWQPLKSA